MRIIARMASFKGKRTPIGTDNVCKALSKGWRNEEETQNLLPYHVL